MKKILLFLLGWLLSAWLIEQFILLTRERFVVRCDGGMETAGK